ncbi:MAG: hypothetical protein WDW38_010673 [Sanguina aurantia]
MLFAGKFSSCSSRGAPLDNRQQARSQHVCHAQWLENKATVDVPVPLEACFKLWDDRERIPNWMPWIKSVKVLENDARLSRWTLSTNQFGRDWEFSWLARNLPPVKNTKIHWVSEPGTSMPGRMVWGAALGQARGLRSLPQTNTDASGMRPHRVQLHPWAAPLPGGSRSASPGPRDSHHPPTAKATVVSESPWGPGESVARWTAGCAVTLVISYEVPDASEALHNLLTPVVEGILKTDMERFREVAIAAK